MWNHRLALAFWHPRERRLRAAWRVAATVITAVGLAIGLAHLLAPFIGGAWAANIGGLSGFTLIAVLAARYLDRRPVRDLGFAEPRFWVADLTFGLGLGLLLPIGMLGLGRALGFYDVAAGPMIGGSGAARAITGAALGFVAVGFYEEILVRGYLLRNVAEGFNWRPGAAGWAVLAAWVVTSVAFAGGHAGNHNATGWSILALIAAGLFAGLGRITTGSLAIPIGVHIAWNFAESILGLPVSGDVGSARLFDIHLHGPIAWTGGAFGPEGGGIGLLAYMVGCVAILLWTRVRYGRVRLVRSLAEYGTGGVQQAPLIRFPGVHPERPM